MKVLTSSVRKWHFRIATAISIYHSSRYVHGILLPVYLNNNARFVNDLGKSSIIKELNCKIGTLLLGVLFTK